MTRWVPALLLISLGGCTFPAQVHRMGVSYNNAVANVSDELTLLNIARAEQRLPLHYTGFSRLNGSLTFTGGGGFNAAVHGPGTTVTDTDAATTAAAGNSVINTVARAATTGGSLYTPSVTGSVTTGPNFDIDILDTQEFYRGVLQSIPFATVEAFLNQGIDSRLLMDLLIERVEYTSPIDLPNQGIRKGDLIGTFINEPEDPAGAPDFVKFFQCFTLSGGPVSPTELAPVSRITKNGATNVPLKMDDLAKLDGKALTLSDTLKEDGSNDASVMVERPGADDRGPILVPNYQSQETETCKAASIPVAAIATSSATSTDHEHRSSGIDRRELRLLLNFEGVIPAAPSKSNKGGLFDFRDGEPEAAKDRVPGTVGARDFNRKALRELINANLAPQRDIVFRSPEGVIKFLGAYLRATQSPTDGRGNVSYPPALWSIAYPGEPLFAVSTSSRPPVEARVIAHSDGTTFALEPGTRSQNVIILGLVEELINLQKKSTDRLTTQPVQIVR